MPSAERMNSLHASRRQAKYIEGYFLRIANALKILQLRCLWQAVHNGTVFGRSPNFERIDKHNLQETLIKIGASQTLTG